MTSKGFTNLPCVFVLHKRTIETLGRTNHNAERWLSSIWLSVNDVIKSDGTKIQPNFLLDVFYHYIYYMLKSDVRCMITFDQ